MMGRSSKCRHFASSKDATLLMHANGLQLSGLYQYSPLGERLGWYDTLLASLLITGNQEKIEAFQRFGIMEFINVYDELGNLPLGTMAQRGDRKIAQWLLDHGADINAHAASTKFPPPTYTDGRPPELWPPEHKTK